MATCTRRELFSLKPGTEFQVTGQRGQQAPINCRIVSNTCILDPRAAEVMAAPLINFDPVQYNRQLIEEYKQKGLINDAQAFRMMQEILQQNAGREAEETKGDEVVPHQGKRTRAEGDAPMGDEGPVSFVVGAAGDDSAAMPDSEMDL